MITSKLRTILTSSGCTLVLYESDKIANLKVDQGNQNDIIGLIIQPNEVLLEVKANAILEHYPPVLIEVIQQVELEGAADDNEVKLQTLLDICKDIIVRLIYDSQLNPLEGFKFKSLTTTKIQETKYDANVIGWSMPLDITRLKNENKAFCISPVSIIILPPTLFSATVISDTQIDLAWINNIDGDAVIIERSLNGNDFTEIYTTLAGATTYSNTGLTEGTRYYYRIRAFDSGNYSAYTSVEEVIDYWNLQNIIKDIDNNIYTEIVIGDQAFLKENLKVTKYNDGTLIPFVLSDADWMAQDGTAGKDGAFAYPAGEVERKAEYGLLYNWFSLNSVKGICPIGYHIPTVAEFDKLIAKSGSAAGGGNALKERGNVHWTTNNTDATNATGLTLIPAGMRVGANGTYGYVEAFWIGWKSDEYNVGEGNRLYIQKTDGTITSGTEVKQSGQSVLCIKDDILIKNVIFDGDSLTFGHNSTDGNSYPQQLANKFLRYKNILVNVINFGVSGQKLTDMESDAAAQIDVLKDADHKLLISWGGINDFQFDLGASKEDIYARAVTYWTNRKAAGWKCYPVTLLPASSFVRAGFETERLWFNNQMRTILLSSVSGIIDVASDSRIGLTGCELDTTYYANDKIHLNNVGYGIVADIVADRIKFYIK